MAPISTIFGRNRSRRPKLFFPKFSRGRKHFRGDEKNFAATKKFRNARTIERTRCQKVPGKRRSRVVIDGYKIDAVKWQDAVAEFPGHPPDQNKHHYHKSPKRRMTILFLKHVAVRYQINKTKCEEIIFERPPQPPRRPQLPRPPQRPWRQNQKINSK